MFDISAIDIRAIDRTNIEHLTTSLTQKVVLSCYCRYLSDKVLFPGYRRDIESQLSTPGNPQIPLFDSIEMAVSNLLKLQQPLSLQARTKTQEARCSYECFPSFLFFCSCLKAQGLLQSQHICYGIYGIHDKAHMPLAISGFWTRLKLKDQLQQMWHWI